MSRRQSVVSLVFYSSMRKKVIAKTKIFSLIKRILDDEDYYVQKGIGWTLREAGNVYPEAALKFIESNLPRISSTAFSAATEKISLQYKSKLKEQRKQFRKQRK